MEISETVLLSTERTRDKQTSYLSREPCEIGSTPTFPF